jgi:hypothetical protein
MKRWTVVFDRFGFSLMYLKDPNFTLGWSFSFCVRKFHIGFGITPDYIGVRK